MQKIYYLKIQNFKVFSQEVIINFDNPTVLIGANNSGKTSVIQALSLWAWAVQTWFDKKKNSKSKKERGIGLNRKEIPQITIKESRYFWHKAKIKKSSTENIDLTIKVGIWYENEIQEVGMIFKYHSPETLYCQPTEETLSHKGLLEFATQLKINLLYPIVGMKAEEDNLSFGSIQRIIGQGQAASVIRNICNLLFESDKERWKDLVNLMKTIFSVEIKEPNVLNNGLIELYYNYSDKERKTVQDLDISLAGYGQQQMLLVLAYLLANKNSVLMIDEPDAHLEILRQSQIFSILKEVSQKYDCQVIIVTHSEVVLNEAEKVVFLADGQAQEISDRNEYKFIKNALRDFGIEHFYKAKINPHILYVEGSTDIEMLRAFAKKFNHDSATIFEGKLNFYYTQNEIPERNIDNELKEKSGSYKNLKSHFQALKSIIPNLKAIGIFDNDNKNRQNEKKDDLAILYWKKYELENYFIYPKTILAFAEQAWKQSHAEYVNAKLDRLKEVIDQELILPVLNDDKQAFSDFKSMPESLQNVQFQNLSSTKKLSDLLENVFEKVAATEKEPILLRKGNFYQLIDYLESMPPEIKENLDELEKYLTA
jgi:predicted ATPase